MYRILVAALGAAAASSFLSAPEAPMTVKRITPIVFVEAIEPCLPFWTERLGFEQTMQVPGEHGLNFAAVARDGAELMYQTVASIEEDLPTLEEHARRTATTLFLEVDDVDAVAGRLDGIEVVQPMRTTFYGAREIWVRAPCGTIVGFAEFAAEGQ